VPSRSVTVIGFFRPMERMFSTISSKTFMLRSREFRTSILSMGTSVTLSGVSVIMGVVSFSCVIVHVLFLL
jgi:hypothetical protein